MLEWLSHPENSKPLGLLIFFVTFLGILWFVFGNKQRGQKLESYKDIPFLDEEEQAPGVRPGAAKAGDGEGGARTGSDMKGKS